MAVKVILCDPFNEDKEFDFDIEVYDNLLARDWIHSLREDCLKPNLPFHHQFCFLGFAKTYRDYDYLCDILNESIAELNQTFDYQIPEVYSKEMITQESLNTLHNHFEILKGTMWEPSEYFLNTNERNRENIERLNWTCHELESLEFATEMAEKDPDNLRPTNIMHFVNAPKYDLKDEHRELFVNGFDSRFGEVYMHWCQIGKRLDEVFRDEGAPDLVYTDPTDIRTKQEDGGARCEAITALRYYSGEFDINWGRDMTRENNPFWKKWHEEFFAWIEKNGMDPTDPKLSLGQMPIAKVKIQESFGSTNLHTVWDTLSDHMFVKGIEINEI